MNVLFLTLLSFDSIHERSIYTDLLRVFVKNGHRVYAISPVEKRQNQNTHIIIEENATILRLKIGNTQKTNIVEKGISTIFIEPTFKRAIKTYFSDAKFDLILYSTPPITFVSAIEYIKRRDNAKSYLLLKDIFPQNAVDVGLMTNRGMKGILYKYFRKKERKLYDISDFIGCMSPANVQYIIEHNSNIDKQKVEVCPNTIEVVDKSIDEITRKKIRDKYGIPQEKKVFIYGGNLGRPQGIDFIIECLRSQRDNKNAFFFIVGDGTEYGKLESYFRNGSQQNFKLMKRLPKEDYDNIVAACDVGLIFLDYRFTIPNFPSRILGYIQAKLPVLACTDKNTDVGKIIVDGGFGWWCESDNTLRFNALIDEAINANTRKLGEIAYRFLCDNYTAERGYEIIREKML